MTSDQQDAMLEIVEALANALNEIVRGQPIDYPTMFNSIAVRATKLRQEVLASDD